MSIDVKVNRLHRIENEATKLRAFVDIEINETFLVKGLAVKDSKNGLFVSMPRQKGKDSKWYEVVRALTPIAREKISNMVLEEYKKGAAA